jgi:hypothetical protein
MLLRFQKSYARKLRDRKPGLFNALEIFDHTGLNNNSPGTGIRLKIKHGLSARASVRHLSRIRGSKKVRTCSRRWPRWRPVETFAEGDNPSSWRLGRFENARQNPRLTPCKFLIIPVVRSWKPHLGLTADCRQNEALVSCCTKCDRFVVTVFPR